LRGWVYPFSVRDYPAAGLNSSAADLAKFLIALDAGKVLRPESLRALWSPVRLNDGAEKGYGLGWTVGEHEGRKVVGHEGGGAIWVAHFPDEHLSVIVLCNLNGARADEIQYGIADLYRGR
jgi:CubicO group peptidase (beta-lactamase class C family)